MNKDNIISIYPDDELRKDLEDAAKEESRSINNMACILLRSAIESRKAKEKRARG